MSYIDGFITPVVDAARERFAEHARAAAAIVREHGAIRVIDTWGVDVPAGQRNDIAGAVRMVGLGMTVFKPHEAPAGPPLTEREREVLEAVASGATNREIAERLFLSPHTVKEHTSSLYRKLKVRNRAEAVQRAQRMGLIS